MDGLQFTAEVIKALAWPLAVVLIASMFKGKLERLLEKVRHAKGAGFEFEFTEGLKKAAEDAKQVVAETPKTAEEHIHNYWSRFGRQPDLRERPSAIVLDAWNEVEMELVSFIVENNIDVPPGTDKEVSQWLSAIASTRKLSARTLGVAGELYELRNKVAHSSEWEPTLEDAKNYASTARAVVDSIRNAALPAVARRA